ncbi:hypothetical protein EVAR_42937_1 [Eumeta japonica]|uniref:FLYWCH-type domain-containing protein n=1 Tax=Eumeta variegata TaxID=151549 RepID=A0A4C1YHE4_EUMVA|nr:hypothetical protein EVAR_42937_1 [Eumeta japonica]
MQGYPNPGEYTDRFKQEIHYITSKKGNKLLVYEQYTYAKNCSSRTRITWTCSSRCSRRCNAQVALTSDGELLILNGEHSHPPPVFYVNDRGAYVRISDKRLSMNRVFEDETIYDDFEHSKC